MTLHLDISPELESQLHAEATQLGLPLSDYVLHILAAGKWPMRKLNTASAQSSEHLNWAVIQSYVHNKPRILGLHPGAMVPADDFDAPLPDEFWIGQDGQA